MASSCLGSHGLHERGKLHGCPGQVSGHAPPHENNETQEDVETQRHEKIDGQVDTYGSFQKLAAGT